MNERHALLLLLEGVFVSVQIHFLRLKYHYISAILALAVCSGSLWQLFIAPPEQFPAGHIITIEEGASATSIADSLHADGIIRSPVLFKALSRISGNEEGIKSGKYIFAEPIGLWSVYTRLVLGIHGINATRIVITEGYRVTEIGRLLKSKFPDFDEEAFVLQALPLEGYLFPDTYFLYPDVTPEDLIELMYANFEEQKLTIEEELLASDRPFPDVLIVASLLEEEARGLEEKRMVAGIIWNRVDLNMLLQVDAVFAYINDVPIYSPLFSDLEVDSPYNTYQHKGLMPGPIGNPGIVSIKAALTPIESDYLFYLTGRDGKMYYAKTFEEHKRNRANYLD